MQRVHNRLLIAVVLFVVATCACLYGQAEARSYSLGGSPSYSALKSVVGSSSGEPDSGDSGKTPHTSGGGTSGSTRIMSPSSPDYGWIIPAWAVRYLAVGW